MVEYPRIVKRFTEINFNSVCDIIFDDIYTTGSTANECAKTLIEAGAKDVGILTIARD